MAFFDAGRTLNIAHRGASAVAPQNTLTAFEMAAELGAEGIEFDVRLCADGVPVVIHDADVGATTDERGRVSRMTLAQLKRLDAGSWFDLRFAGERIPTLEEVLETFGHRLLLNIELKSNLKGGLLDKGLERAVVALVERYELDGRVLISSFSPFALRRVQLIAPHIPTGLLYGVRSLPIFGLAGLILPKDCAAFHPHYEIVGESHIAKAHRRGYRMQTWTVDEPSIMRSLIAWGVDGIITNRPDVLRDVIDDHHVPLGLASKSE